MSIDLLANGVLIAVAGFLIYIACYDFRHLKIRNVSVLALLGLYGVWAALTGFATLAQDLAAALLLFGIGFVMWMLRMMGAGDAKLYFGLGLFMGMTYLGAFAILLLGITLVFLVMLYLAGRSAVSTGFVGHLREMKQTGKVPYAVVLCAAATPTILARAFT